MLAHNPWDPKFHRVDQLRCPFNVVNSVLFICALNRAILVLYLHSIFIIIPFMFVR